MKDLFFKNWESLYHILICGTIAYLSLFIFIKISGKRTLAKLNAFDFVVSVTLGSILSSIILLKVSIAEGLTGLFIIISLQYLLAFLAKKSDTMEKVINSTPSLLFYNGKFLNDALQNELITKEEVYAEIRSYKIENINDVRAVVLELNGDMTVVKKSDVLNKKTSLKDIIKE
ncbi:DUF421 domain-containing protein [Flavobacterium sp. CBA20B-1]|uniref:DUF421 domain-containing protein n=1 Tax=unclassified Flavobacterium TaxID=196869 RepID=UPI002224B9D9|nr:MULTISPECIES: YetF domain-containing protein [unclassified Flavobacterium]WCM42353.1 DUF421 domain-containing protein [Flavobacterium sp. CBA20B-1]